MIDAMMLSGKRKLAIGQVAFTSEGNYSWTVPDGVYSVSVVAVGSGGYSSLSGHTHFNNELIAYSTTGAAGGTTAGADGGGPGGDGGSGDTRYVSGGNAQAGGGGGGAGGYTSSGDAGGNASAGTTAGNKANGGGGGGVGLHGGDPSSGQGPGAEGGDRGYHTLDGLCGLGRSGGTPDTQTRTTNPGLFGGGRGGFNSQNGRGGGGLGYKNNIPVTPGQTLPINVRGNGAVRVIWPGNERYFPTTRTADEFEEQEPA